MKNEKVLSFDKKKKHGHDIDVALYSALAFSEVIEKHDSCKFLMDEKHALENTEGENLYKLVGYCKDDTRDVKTLKDNINKVYKKVFDIDKSHDKNYKSKEKAIINELENVLSEYDISKAKKNSRGCINF